ncbi:hypothetical protein KP24_04115 [Pectobacterium atrosepticum]|uniref:DUF1800 domain-containing protein n=1 Tax=Pectobacterium atrosepticum TaxID=29471 RepID=UPI0005003C19|nr:DUF1800 domain-containing protein [Pectobacterium atrosepticum]KFX25870.1 hypothetical protein KP24_04115 [Pectobacterium atrosepticum]
MHKQDRFVSAYRPSFHTQRISPISRKSLVSSFVFHIPCLFILLWTLTFSTSGVALTIAETRHLIDRTGFGTTPQDIERFNDMTREQAVDYLLGTLNAPFYTLPPTFVQKPYPDYWQEGWREQKMILLRINEINQLQAWWVQEMILTPTPFADRLTLFWHNHFVSRFDNTLITAPFFDQLTLFRQAGSQSFRLLARKILQDPMMLSGLDNTSNTRQHPNENLARELMELFTLGEGNYSENDVKQVAKILAGHGVNATQHWRYQFDASAAVSGEKMLLGQKIQGTPDEELDQLVDVLLSQPQTATRLAGKFYRAFISLEDDPETVSALAQVLRNHDYAMKPFMRALLLSPEFWHERHRGALVKSPLDLIVGFSRTLSLVLPDQHILLDYLKNLGQSPFMAPSVAGWEEGTAWLDGKTLVDRTRVLTRLWSAVENPPPPDNTKLIVRFSSENRGLPARFIVTANGQQLARITAKLGADTRQEQASNEPGNLKPMWETVAIPLPNASAVLENLTITMDADEPDTHLFINWISFKGYRFSPHQASWIIPEGSSCLADSPLGSFYCNLSLSFDLTAPIRSEAASLIDRHAPLNANIEYGTGRLRPQFSQPGNQLPAIITPYTRIPIDSLLATTPLGQPVPPDNSASALKALTLDPAFNLK